MNPNINIELGMCLSVPQVEICEIITKYISPRPWPLTLKMFSLFKSPWQQIEKEIYSMFLSILEDEIFQAELSNIENINLFNMQMREVIWKWDVLDSSKDGPLLNFQMFKFCVNIYIYTSCQISLQSESKHSHLGQQKNYHDSILQPLKRRSLL
jgi:hypothetical protein